MIKNDVGKRWEIIHSDPAVGDPTVRRYPVPGGWLYQVQDGVDADFGPPTFVPDPNRVHIAPGTH